MALIKHAGDDGIDSISKDLVHAFVPLKKRNLLADSSILRAVA